MTRDGDIEFTTRRRALIGALIEQLHGLPLKELEYLVKASDYWQHRAQRKEESAARQLLKFARRKRAK